MGFRVWGLWFRVLGVWGLRFRASGFKHEKILQAVVSSGGLPASGWSMILCWVAVKELKLSYRNVCVYIYTYLYKYVWGM